MLDPYEAMENARIGLDFVTSRFDGASWPSEVQDYMAALSTIRARGFWTKTEGAILVALQDGVLSVPQLVVVDGNDPVPGFSDDDMFHTQADDDGSIRVYMRRQPILFGWCGVALYHEFSHVFDLEQGRSLEEDSWWASEARANLVSAFLLDDLAGGSLLVAIENQLRNYRREVSAGELVRDLQMVASSVLPNGLVEEAQSSAEQDVRDTTLVTIAAMTVQSFPTPLRACEMGSMNSSSMDLARQLMGG